MGLKAQAKAAEKARKWRLRAEGENGSENEGDHVAVFHVSDRKHIETCVLLLQALEKLIPADQYTVNFVCNRSDGSYPATSMACSRQCQCARAWWTISLCRHLKQKD